MGIPLLLVTVTKSGHQIASSSINCLLIMRHYCISLPVHYLCCSCNLFLCLRWLSWCCCCCCCSYLCCLNDNKQKCCDDQRAPKLKLIVRPNHRKGRKQRRHHSERQLLSSSEAYRQQQLSTSGASSFVIGFNVPPPSETHDMGKQIGDQQKSVRFSGGQTFPHDSDLQRRQLDDGGSSDDCDKEDGLSSAHLSRGAFTSSLSLLAIYVFIGAYYISRTQHLSIVDSLYTCYSMLATSKLPDSFQLDHNLATKDPFKVYKTLQSSAVTAVNGGDGTSRSKLAEKGHKSPGRLKLDSAESLTLDAFYLLVGLNLISTCAHFGRLWLKGMVKRRFQRQKCPNAKQAPAPLCNGQVPSSMQIGQLDHYQPPDHNSHYTQHDSQQQQQSSFTFDTSDTVSNLPGGSQAVVSLSSSIGGANVLVTNGRTSSNSSGQEQLTTSGHQHQLHHHHHAASPLSLASQQQQQDQINLAQLFVMSASPHQLGASGGHYQPGNNGGGQSEASFTSDQSSSTAPRSLCAHHQSALAIHQGLAPAVAASYDAGSNHIELTVCADERRHGAPTRLNEMDELDHMLRASCGTLRGSGAKIRTSASSLHLVGSDRGGPAIKLQDNGHQHHHQHETIGGVQLDNNLTTSTTASTSANNSSFSDRQNSLLNRNHVSILR